ncbi:ABC transporter permease [Kangiella koreensis]|uniref:Transport permease protein n=1 Tax=Kangiella koreensis (strain DSM 16069 / JCM 12317 / KCTC 12182 / SW-125) TaxID=523791 RepID=C7R9D4_KANKD|nr:ABC transporter permease [Kangiella koreensis]ACV26025.1 ABC-2 type transporter [Kangiella koreensis DSM 16069]
MNLVAFQTIVTKEIIRWTRIWSQTLLPPAITMTLYFVIFGNLIGSRVGEMGGFGYMEYIVPGLIMMSVITSSYGNVVSSFFSAKYQRSIEEMMVSPVSNWVILYGFVGGGVLRGLLTGLIVTIIASFFVELKVYNAFVVVSVVFLTSVLFAIGGFLNALFARKFDDVAIVPTFILTPLTYLGGVFYSISLLPEFWQGVSKANPIIYMVNAFRYGFLGASDIDITVAFVLILAFIVALTSLSIYLLNRGTGLRA